MSLASRSWLARIGAGLANVVFVGWLVVLAKPAFLATEKMITSEQPTEMTVAPPKPSGNQNSTIAQTQTLDDPVNAPLPETIRDVSPAGVSAPNVDGALVRIDPSERYLELKDPPVEPVPSGDFDLVRSKVLDGGRLLSENLVIQLAYIEPLDPKAMCLSRLGGDWPCGARAKTFLQGLVRQFKISCEKIDQTGPREVIAVCQRGKIDLSKRLIEYGWANASDSAPAEYKNLAEAAKQKRIGKWQSEWLSEARDPEAFAPAVVDWSQPVSAN